MDILSIAITFWWTIYHVGGLQQLLFINITVTFWQLWNGLLYKLHGVCHQIIPNDVALSAFPASYIAQNIKQIATVIIL